jgi:ribonuclease P protein component
VGNAVVRNRLKRAIREWFRTSRGALREGIDVVVAARRGAGELRCLEVAAALDEIAGKGGCCQ